jgi:hypothetical protein
MSLPVHPRLPVRRPLTLRPSGGPRPSRRLPFRPLALVLRRARAETPPAPSFVWRSIDGGRVTLAPSLTVNLTLVESPPLPAAPPRAMPGAPASTERAPLARQPWHVSTTTATTFLRPVERETQPHAAIIRHPHVRSLMQQLCLHLLRQPRDARPPATPLPRAVAPSTRLTYRHLHHSTAGELPSPAAGQRLDAAVPATLQQHTTRLAQLVEAALLLTAVARAQAGPVARAHHATSRLERLALHRPPTPSSASAHRAAQLPSRPSPARAIAAPLAPPRRPTDARALGAAPAPPALHLLPAGPAAGPATRLPATGRWHVAPLVPLRGVAAPATVVRWRPGERPSAAPSLRLHTREIAPLATSRQAAAPASRLAAVRLQLVMRSDLQHTRHHTVSRSERQVLPVEIRWRETPAARATPAATPAPPPPPAPALPDMARLTREVTRELEKRVRVERQRRGRL